MVRVPTILRRAPTGVGQARLHWADVVFVGVLKAVGIFCKDGFLSPASSHVDVVVDVIDKHDLYP